MVEKVYDKETPLEWLFKQIETINDPFIRKALEDGYVVKVQEARYSRDPELGLSMMRYAKNHAIDFSWVNIAWQVGCNQYHLLKLVRNQQRKERLLKKLQEKQKELDMQKEQEQQKRE